MRSVPGFTPAFVFLVLQAFAAVQAEDLYNQVGVLKGQVVIVNNPDLGHTPAAGQYFTLQRADCHRCLVGVRTDIEGRYTAYIGIGRYRIWCADPECKGKDLIRKGQQREVTVRRRPNDTVFNIELELPKPR